VGDDVLVDSDAFLVINFVNLKINSTQSFKYTHMNRIYVSVFIRISSHRYMGIYIVLRFAGGAQHRTPVASAEGTHIWA
jgi:hypothetical protein